MLHESGRDERNEGLENLHHSRPRRQQGVLSHQWFGRIYEMEKFVQKRRHVIVGIRCIVFRIKPQRGRSITSSGETISFVVHSWAKIGSTNGEMKSM
jgi:hypothetical protein